MKPALGGREILGVALSSALDEPSLLVRMIGDCLCESLLCGFGDSSSFFYRFPRLGQG
jgi:hypothetical protein